MIARSIARSTAIDRFGELAVAHRQHAVASAGACLSTCRRVVISMQHGTQ
jgi:hypothetical protein